MHNLKPKKHLGQHFLTDKRLATRIVDLLGVGEEANVVEIGPGKGILTQFLLERYPNLFLVEVDPEAVAYIRHHFESFQPNLIHEDVLKWDLRNTIPTDTSFIGNLPYNISSPIFFRLLENRDYVKEGVFMIQKEVAQRICSPKGSKVYGILSVLMGYYYELSLEISVPPGAFHPPPRVQSAVIRMVRRENIEALDFSDFKKVVKAAFGKRRKTLRNALKGIEFKDFEGKESLFGQRAEQLGIDDFVNLVRQLRRSD